MPYRTIILGLPRSMTFWTSVTLGFDHDVSAWPVESPKSGLCDTAFVLLPQEEQKKYFDSETKFVHLWRPEAEVLSSLMRNFPKANPAALATALTHTAARLHDFFLGCPHLRVPAPLSPAGLHRLAHHLGREAEAPRWIAALSQRRDRLDDPVIRAQCARTFEPKP